MTKVQDATVHLSLHERALVALRVAVERAVADHAHAGVPMYVWRDGEVVELSPEELRMLSSS
jgi:hypothetical protein